MSDRRHLFGLKIAIENDSKLSHGAARLGLLICSYIYNHPQHRWTPDEPFPLPWTEASKFFFGTSKAEIYSCLRELQDRGHIFHVGLKGCPAKAHYRLPVDLYSCPQPKTARSLQMKTARSLQTVTPSSTQPKTASSTGKNSPRRLSSQSPQISNSLREGIVKSMEVNSSLRSKGNEDGKVVAATPQELTDEQRIAAARELKNLRENLKRS